MRQLGERVLEEHLFYELTNIGPISSIHAAKPASSDAYTSAGNGEYWNQYPSTVQNCFSFFKIFVGV